MARQTKGKWEFGDFQTHALQFFESMIFWSEKRPITVEILKRLDLHALSRELGCEQYQNFAKRRKGHEMENAHGQLSLGIAQTRAKCVVDEGGGSWRWRGPVGKA